MPRIVEKTVFKFDELSDRAKEKAREWFREGNLDYDWYEAVYEDAAHVADILGIDLDQKPVKLMGGGTRYDPAIYFSGFYSQGDGACFEGSYEYKKRCAKNIKKHAPEDAELHRIANELTALQQRHGYKLTARMQHRGHYSHSGCMAVEVDTRDGAAIKGWAEVDDDLTQLMRDFADWIYKQLRDEYEHQNSDEVVDDNIRANEYEFNEEGSRA